MFYLFFPFLAFLTFFILIILSLFRASIARLRAVPGRPKFPRWGSAKSRADVFFNAWLAFHTKSGGVTENSVTQCLPLSTTR